MRESILLLLSAVLVIVLNIVIIAVISSIQSLIDNGHKWLAAAAFIYVFIVLNKLFSGKIYELKDDL